jgi:hypothetical protein
VAIATIEREVAVMPTASDEKTSRGKNVGPVRKRVPVDLRTETWFQPNLSFRLALGERAKGIRIPVTVVRTESGRGLLLQPDAYGMVQLLQMKASNNKIDGSLRYSKDIVLLRHITALERAIGYTQTQAGNGLLAQMLGLNLPPQNHVDQDRASELRLNDPNQSRTILAAAHPENTLTLGQGPPGTGKTTTVGELVRLVSRRDPAEPLTDENRGTIFLITAPAHAGADTVSLRLLEQGVRVVRSASDDAGRKITKKGQLDELHKQRLDLLMQYITDHREKGIGFAYVATNNGLPGDVKCWALFNLYLSGAPMDEIGRMYAMFQAENYNVRRELIRSDAMADKTKRDARKVIHPFWLQDEAGQATAAELLSVYFAVNPERAGWFGDQDQLAPVGITNVMETRITGMIEADAKKMSSNESEIRRIVQEKKKRILSGEARDAMSMSLFEVIYDYCAFWSYEQNGATVNRGASLHFLSIARRSIALIIRAVVSEFYKINGKHLEPGKEHDPQPTPSDAVMIVNTDGIEQPAPTRDGISDDERNGTSKWNFREVGDVIRMVSYYMNNRNPGTGRNFEPNEILILTPYSAQNRMINEVLWVVGLLNDLARGNASAIGQLETVRDILRYHVRMARDGRVALSDVETLLRQIHDVPSERSQRVADLYGLLSPIYVLRFTGVRKIRLADVAQLQTGDIDVAGEGLDEMESNRLEAKTVHRVQGQEKDAVIVSLVRTNGLGFLGGRKGLRILNVAFSRAVWKLSIVYSRGNAPSIVDTIARNLIAESAKYAIRSLAPYDKMASVLNAWVLRWRLNDRVLAPIWETALALWMLTHGLAEHDPALFVEGMLIAVIVPALAHALPGWLGIRRDDPQSFTHEARYWTALGLSATATWTLLTAFGVPAQIASRLALLVPVGAHFARNNHPNRSWTDLIKTPQKLGVNDLNGLPSQPDESALLMPIERRALNWRGLRERLRQA